MKTDNQTDKWIWMMDYCKKQSIPPAQKWAWDLVEKKYEDYVRKNVKINDRQILV